MKKSKPIIIALIIAALVIAIGSWLWLRSQQPQPLTLYGNVDIRTVEMSFRVGGRLESLAVDEGDSIKAGQVLGQIDKAPYDNALMQAQPEVLRVIIGGLRLFNR